MWSVATTDDYDGWFAALDDAAKVELIAVVNLLRVFGPRLSRPHADTLNGSKHAHMKELRARTPGTVLRVAFAFDPTQKAILLVGGDKSGVNEKRFYKQLLSRADKLYAAHLASVKAGKKGKGK